MNLDLNKVFVTITMYNTLRILDSHNTPLEALLGDSKKYKRYFSNNEPRLLFDYQTTLRYKSSQFAETHLHLMRDYIAEKAKDFVKKEKYSFLLHYECTEYGVKDCYFLVKTDTVEKYKQKKDKAVNKILEGWKKSGVGYSSEDRSNFNNSTKQRIAKLWGHYKYKVHITQITKDMFKMYKATNYENIKININNMVNEDLLICNEENKNEENDS